MGDRHCLQRWKHDIGNSTEDTALEEFGGETPLDDRGLLMRTVLHSSVYIVVLKVQHVLQ